MKRDQGVHETGKIIPFPGLKQRYYEKGVACLEAHNFHDAVQLLRHAKEMDETNPNINSAFLAALYENGDYVEAKILAEEILREGIGHYFEIIDVYLMILIQLNEHQYVIDTIEALFDEKEVPAHKAEHFLTILQLSKKVVENNANNYADEFSTDQAVFNSQDLHEQTIQLGSLVDKNIHPYLDSLLNMLEDNNTHPFLKTIVLNVLRENKIEKKVKVKKLNYDGYVIPANLLEVQEMPLLMKINKHLEILLGDHNPVLLEQLKEMTGRHAFILYPFEVNPVDPKLWAAAYRCMGYEMYGEKWNKEKIATTYGVNCDEMVDAFSYLLSLEEISSPIQ
ncbi:tetratricopeptide repeat protein [Lederbergia wuyishanensis]|uniref:Tetratricopeptide (TPR) repeat protein n=1 Tax=Lederbergia wuyishanensis TaxID=1347903 RepID=A0ABU0D1Y4_9BACI|nr:tetratricopeptide repeat protein [Lederbergia wuyishanensis]MCJ8007015.1 tetratricopeptide repeat protein [Lederbergia wuyishanensis]MDQ0342399.1 tetratricopeptide (TPR) repeat protein [Lederbergia wuyishanensis]